MFWNKYKSQKREVVNRFLENDKSGHRKELITQDLVSLLNSEITNPFLDFINSKSYITSQKYYDICEEHSKKHESKLKDEVVVLVHPFYLYLAHNNLIKDSNLGESLEYISNLKKLLDSDKSIVIAETFHTYGMLTSSLLEKKIIDKVIFTAPSPFDVRGKLSLPFFPVERKAYFDNFQNKDISFAGCYINRCLDDTISSFTNYGNISFSIIPEMILCSLEDSNSLFDTKKKIRLLNDKEEPYFICKKSIF